MIVKKAEEFFNIPFADIINILHIKNKISLNELSKRSGIPRQSITSAAKRLGLKTRNVQQATKLTNNKGCNHYAYGSNKHNSERCKKSSIRMTNENPIRNIVAKEKRAKTISKTFIKNILPQEIIFKDILEKIGVEFEMQKPIGPYNLDFYIKKSKYAVEIDSTDKWGVKRRSKAKERDLVVFNDYNIKTFRINKRFLDDEDSIIKSLKDNNII